MGYETIAPEVLGNFGLLVIYLAIVLPLGSPALKVLPWLAHAAVLAQWTRCVGEIVRADAPT